MTCAVNVGFKDLYPGMWNTLSGSLAIVRVDIKPLHIAHIDALVEYCAEVGGSRDRVND